MVVSLELSAVDVSEVGLLNVEMILTAFGGVGLFLYGMGKMSEGLQKAAGDKMRRILEVLTVNPLASVTAGVVVTAVIQSSAATTVMCVSFVNAGLMKLEQAIGVIMGANIGTTITAQLVAFNLERIALPAIAIGMVFMLLGRRRSVKGFADFLVGFGMLFLGITIVGNALEPLKHYEPFLNLMLLGEKHPLIGILVGIVATVVLQSSSALTGLLVTMASRGIITLSAAVPILLGSNIGTTSTALISSIGTSLTARRTAMAHFLFNVVGTLILLPILHPFENVIAMSSVEASRQIANAHTMFNVVATIVLLPFINRFASLVCKVLKGEDLAMDHGPKYLDPRLILTPFMAVMQTEKEVARMADLCVENLKTAVAIFQGDQGKDRRRFDDIEEIIDEIEEAINYYVAKISQQDVSESQAKVLTSVISICADLERIGDHATSLVELADYRYENNLPFSDEAVKELDEMISKVVESLETAIEALKSKDKTKASSIVTLDDALDQMERDLRAKHIRRLNQGICYPASGVIYLDVLGHIERIGDHAVNIAEEVLDM
jgi:phosphate:Na+ symporter